MRLRELKCENCGAAVKIEENASQAKCKFCHTMFAVEDSYNDGYNFEKGRMKAHDEQLEKNLEHVKGIIKPVGKFFITKYIITAIVGVFILGIIVTIIIFFSNIQKEYDYDIDIRSFNNTYEMYNGTEYGLSVGRLIDEVSTNNKKNKEHKITIKYKETSTQDSNELKKIKKQLDDWTKYEVSFEYDETGFIYMATIEE